jgi:hypothetical protein
MSAIITRQTPLGGQTYPILERIADTWTIKTHHISRVPELSDVTLRWLNDNHVIDVHIPSMDSVEFLSLTGLELNLNEGGFILSKRLSRIMHPYYLSGFFAADDVTIEYLKLDTVGQKVWDGAGLMSRRMAERLIDHLSDKLPQDRQRQHIHALKHNRRFEFTLLTARGQDKGHCIVVDGLNADFVLPGDTKPQVRLTDGMVFIGLQPVHSADHMRLDIQSLINLHPFFRQEQLLNWLRNESDLFFESIKSGEITAMMGLLDPARLTLDDARGWYVREYLLCGGQPMWFGNIVRALVGQHLKRLNHQALGKMRLPIPGGRYYVMTDTIGGLEVPVGQVKLDPAASTAWVNHADWGQYLADVWGGADQDDALWCYPFRDHDDTVRVLLWRSPNQVGEYVLLKPTPDSFLPGDELPHNDSRTLQPRIDQHPVTYLNLVDEANTQTLDDNEYSPAIMDSDIEQARANRGALGQFCNTLMLAKALYNRLPKTPPAPLETVIDASVKTGADLSRIRAWCEIASQHILEQRQPIPRILHDRLSMQDDSSPIIASRDHWLDHLVTGVQAHIADVEIRRDELMRQTMPPQALFDIAHDENCYAEGAMLNSLYTRILQTTPHSYDRVRQACEQYLYKKDTPQIIRAALSHYYLNDDHNGNAAACWQYGQRQPQGGRAPGIAQMTLDALREIGLLDELDTTGCGLLVYPGASIKQASAAAITIHGMWFNRLKTWCEQHGEPVPQQMSDVSPVKMRWAKRQIAQLAAPIILTIQQENGRKVAYDEHGQLFGYVARTCDAVPVGQIELHNMQAIDGNLRGTYNMLNGR